MLGLPVDVEERPLKRIEYNLGAPRVVRKVHMVHEATKLPGNENPLLRTSPAPLSLNPTQRKLQANALARALLL